MRSMMRIYHSCTSHYDKEYVCNGWLLVAKGSWQAIAITYKM